MIGRSYRKNISHAGCIAGLVMLVLGVAAGATPAQSPPDAAQNSRSFWFRILVPDDQVPSHIGRASFRLGSDMVLVFAARLPIRQSALQDVSGISNAVVVHLPDATIVRIPLPPGQSVHAVPSAGSFHIVLGQPEHTEQAIPSFVNGQIVVPTIAADRTVTYAPSADKTLLVGTVTSDVALGRELAGPGYATIAADNGVVIAAESDELALMPGPQGFALHSSVQTVDLPVGNPPVAGDQSAMPRRADGLDLPHVNLVELRRRIEAAQRRITQANSVDRVAVSVRLAKTLISAGLGQEARGVLTDLPRRNPETLDDPQRRLLLDIADVVADRPAPGIPIPPSEALKCGRRRGPDPILAGACSSSKSATTNGKRWGQHAGSLGWPALTAAAGRSDETLWMGIATAQSGDAASAASLLSRSIAPLMALPAPLRARFLPLAAETLIAAGALDAARTVLDDASHDRALSLARAELLQARTHPRQALVAYRALGNNADQRVAGIARFRSIMLRYRLHQIKASAAAASLARHIYDWRGDRHSLNMRLALGKMLARAGDLPRAFTVMTATGQLFPGDTPMIRRARQAMFDGMIKSGALDRLPTLAAVSILRNNADLIPPGAAGIPILGTLSHRLIALDLPGQAIPILRQMLARAPDSRSRARLGLALAKLDFETGALQQAQSVLASTADSNIDPGDAESRAVLASAIIAQTNPGSGLPASAASSDPKVLAIAAKLAERHRDWPAVETTVKKLAAVALSPTGLLDRSGARVIVQWAVAARRAHDDTTLATLRKKYLGRMPPGRNADLFATMTAPTLTPHASLAEALAQIEAIEKVGATVDGGAAGPVQPK